MDTQVHQFVNLETLISELYTIFDQWEKEDDLADDVKFRTFYLFRLATHEWLANLVQHANFEDQRPQISFQAAFEENQVHCVIEDNAKFFDLERYLRQTPNVLDAFPERGMGLLILRSCTQDLTYTKVRPHVNRLSFLVSADQDPWLNIQF